MPNKILYSAICTKMYNTNMDFNQKYIKANVRKSSILEENNKRLLR